MTDKKLFRKIAPIIMSVVVAMTSSPVGVMAEDFTSGDVAVVEEYTQEEETDTYDEYSEDVASEDAAESGFDAAEEENGFGDGETEDEFTSDSEAALFSDGETEVETQSVEGVEYVLMNIPYEAFYRSQLSNNNVIVDAFTSATLNKSRTAGMMNGNAAYHTDAAGTNLAGVTFPVKISDPSVLANLKQVTDDTSVTISVTNRGQTSNNTYKGKNALIESADYSYYILTETPFYYKELTVDEAGNFSFGPVQGMDAQTVSIASTFTTDTSYGDYELDLNDDTFGKYITLQSGDSNAVLDSVYGAVINTTDGTTYALRHLENIWRGGHLAWSTGFTTTVHGGPVSSAHYVSMMGKTISSVTYYTSKGIINFDIEDTYVPVTTGITATAADVKTSDTALKVELSAALPSDFAVSYTVDGVKAEGKDGVVTIDKLKMGQHEVVVSDANGKYAPISTAFEAKTDVKPAVYNEYDLKLTAATDITAEQFAAYIKAISKVKVGEKEYAATGRGAVTVVKEDGSFDFSKASVNEGDTVTVYATGYENVTFTYSENVYAYAGLTWAQYWAAENVLNAGSTASSDTADRRGEKDLGAFDAVTRATSNHGLHRGSFQTIATIYTTAGNSYNLAGWKDKSTMILTDGSTASFGRGTVNGENIDHYVVSGLKYVPVKVKRADYSAFKEAYTVVENGGTLFGGFGEDNLQAYTATAAVTGSTNGLKTAVKAEDGSFTFSARANGSDSGLKDTAQKTADGITATVKPGNGSYGEFLRVDLTGNYGGLGEAMQAVKWTYYGNDSTYSTPLQSYGTKFAADNWMHRKMGIQLGLSDSLRCQLPEGYDGTGYWTLTVYGLGYADYTVKFQAASENIAKPAGDADSAPLENIIAEAKALNEADYTPESWAAAKDNIANELEECEDMLANISQQTTYGVEEQIGHLREAIDSLVKAEFKLSAEKASLDTDKNKTTTLKVTTNMTGDVTWKSSNEKVATVDKNGKITAVKAGTATITATLGLKSAACTVTVKEAVKPTPTPKPVTPTPAPVLTAKAQAATIYAGGTTGNTTTINVTKSGITEAAKFTSSNTAVATVDANGKVTAKKAGKATITVAAGKLTAKVDITVAKAGVTAKANSAVIYTKGQKSTNLTVTKNGITGTAKYTSSNKKVATVSSKGKVTAKKAGKTVITVKVGKYTTKVTVQVKNPALKLAKSSATIKKGKTVTIKATATPKGTVKYKSSNKKVATVSTKGVVTGKKKGTATITVTCNGVSKKFKVKVK